MSRESSPPSAEWNEKIASAYWPDQPNHWAPVSWKDHLYDFNVFYNGTIIANPTGTGLNPNSLPEDQIFAAELRLRFMTADPVPKHLGDDVSVNAQTYCDTSLMQLQLPDGRHVASWADSPAPVYAIEQAVFQAPIIVRQTQFAHIPGGRAVRSGVEPMFLWVRLAVTDVVDEVNPHERLWAQLTLLAPTVLTGMGNRNNINFNYGYGVPAYPMPLAFDGTRDLKSGHGYLRHGPPPYGHAKAYLHGRRNRLAVPARQRGVDVRYLRSPFFSAANQWLGHVILSMPVKRGATVDFVFPFAPVDDATIDKELSLGYDGALKQSEGFWRRELATKTSIRVPERLPQGWVDQLPRLSAMIAQKQADGDYGLPSGSYHYEAIWPTPMGMQSYALEFCGFGNEVDKYLEPFRLNQGKTKPPSPHLPAHKGYIGAPKTMTGIDWITDHAAILWAATNHAAMSMDADFLRRWTPAIVKACQFIVDARRVTKHPGVKGILPPAVSNDSGWCAQTAWNNAWHHKALRTAARFLDRVGRRAEAKRFLAEADDFRRAFQRHFRAITAKSKTWRAPDGTRLPFVPSLLSAGTGEEAANAFHLDTGPMTLVFGELFDASDPLMRAAVRWFREGPQHRIYRRFSSEWQTPVVDHEISSCEPCYSWNIFHSLELGEREWFTMGLYGLFAGGASRENFVGCETREAVFGNVFSHGTALMLTRLCTISEADDGGLDLMRMTPLAFLENEGFDWKNIPTWFGDLSIAARYDGASGTLDVRYDAPKRSKPARTRLHVPPLPDLRRVMLNGKPAGKTNQSVIEL